MRERSSAARFLTGAALKGLLTHPLTEHIEITSGVCGGKPRIAGTRIRVQDIVVWTKQGLSPDEIVSGYPHLTLADVHAALACYHDHREYIDQQMKEADDFVARMKAKYGPSSQSNTAEQ